MGQTITRDSVPAWRRGIRRSFDAVRGANILQGPERVIVLDDIAAAITELFDSERTIREISKNLAVKYAEDAGLVEADVIGFVQDLADKGLVVT
jgi:pyrroloquinoline quinone biosynthesis protein D